MAQININLTPGFIRDLRRLMKLRGLGNKSDAVRVAVREAAERSAAGGRKFDFQAWIGLARRRPVNPKPRFKTDDDLWRGNA